MTETHPDFLLYSGSTWALDAALHDAACNPLDLTGAAITWRLYNTQGGIKLELTRDNGITVVNEIGGLCRITVTAAQSKDIAQGSYRDEIVVAMPTGFVSTQAVGSIFVNKPGGLPVSAAEIEDPCVTLLKLQNARLGILTGLTQTRVKIEGFEVEYAPGNMNSLDSMIARYDSLCRKKSGKGPRRFAIGSTMRRTQ